MSISGRSYSSRNESEGMKALRGIEEYVRGLRGEIYKNSDHKEDRASIAKKWVIKEVLQYIKDSIDIKEVEERQSLREQQEELQERPTNEITVVVVLQKLSKLWPANLTIGLHKSKLCVRQHTEGEEPKVIAHIDIPGELCSR